MGNGEVRYPEGQEVTLGFSPEPLSVYEGTVWLSANLRVAADAKAGPATVEARLQVQPCDDTQCLQPETGVLRIPITIVATRQPDAEQHQAIFSRL